MLSSRLAPERDYDQRAFAIYTDNTLALTLRNYPEWNPLSKRDRASLLKLERDTCRAARFVFTTSDWARGSMIEDYGCADERVAAAGGGAVVGEEPVRSWASRVALFVGVEFERKGGNTLLAAWPQVRAAVHEAELWIVGLRFRPRRPLPAGVLWFGRVADRSRLSSLYRESSLFVMPSLFEPWGFVFHEAMACGLPCVGSRACAMPEIIEDGVTGRLVARGNADELCGAIVEILSDAPLAERMGRAAYRDVRERHQWAHVAARLSERLETLPETDRVPPSTGLTMLRHECA